MTITAPPHRGRRRGSSVLPVGRVLCARSCNGAGVRGFLRRVCCPWRRVCVPVYEGVGWLSAAGGVCARAAGGVAGTLGDSGAAVSACGRWCEACVCGGGVCVCVRGGEKGRRRSRRVAAVRPGCAPDRGRVGEEGGRGAAMLLAPLTVRRGRFSGCRAGAVCGAACVRRCMRTRGG